MQKLNVQLKFLCLVLILDVEYSYVRLRDILQKISKYLTSLKNEINNKKRIFKLLQVLRAGPTSEEHMCTWSEKLLEISRAMQQVKIFCTVMFLQNYFLVSSFLIRQARKSAELLKNWFVLF